MEWLRWLFRLYFLVIECEKEINITIIKIYTKCYSIFFSVFLLASSRRIQWIEKNRIFLLFFLLLWFCWVEVEKKMKEKATNIRSITTNMFTVSYSSLFSVLLTFERYKKPFSFQHPFWKRNLWVEKHEQEEGKFKHFHRNLSTSILPSYWGYDIFLLLYSFILYVCRHFFHFNKAWTT